MKKNLFKILLLLWMLVPAAAFADTFTVTVPAGTEPVMQDVEATLPLTVTNNGPSRDIREITFQVDTTKYTISASTVPPTGWCVSSRDSQTITFGLLQPSGSCSSGSTAARITPGGSLLFNLVVTPAASTADVANDTLLSASVTSQTGFTLSGSLPTWTRRSFDASMQAAPDSTGVNGTISLQMTVTNRSSVSQSSISGSPSPPTPSNSIVTNTEGPYYGSAALSLDINSATTVIGVGSTAEFPSSGTARIDSEEVCYTGKTSTSLLGALRGCNGTTASGHVSGTPAYSLSQFTLAVNESRSIFWKYRADSTGAVYFTSRATNGGGNAKSPNTNSNSVTIGAFTSTVAVTPASVISGQSVTVEMQVVNNGTTALVNITPTINTCAGGATETLLSGPSPSSISSLAPGSSGTFYWTFTITGTAGQSYCFNGYATANGPVTTPTASSNAGTISNNSVSLTPSSITTGATNTTLTWTVYNGGGCPIQEVDITIPAGGGNWTCSSVTPPANWSGTCSGTVQFQSGGGSSDIPTNGTKSFSITFSTTESVTSDKAVSFPLSLIPKGCGGTPSSLGSAVTVTAYAMALTHSPAGPLYADGSSTYAVTATLTSGGIPLAGKTVTFSTTKGTFSSATAVTDASGNATVNLVAPNSAVDTTATVTAEYLGASKTDTVSYLAWTKPNLQYWGNLAPSSLTCGGTYTVSMQVKNINAVSSMTLGTGSYFAFNDSTVGGANVFTAYLDSPVTVPPNTVVTLSFGSPTSAGGGGGVGLSQAFFEGSYLPSANSSPPPASGLFLTDGGANDQRRPVTDRVATSGSCGTVKVRVIEWHEMR